MSDVPRVARVSSAQLVVAAIRLAVGVALALVADALGGQGRAGIAFAAGALAVAVFALQDPRQRMLEARSEPSSPLPEDAVVESRAQTARVMLFPSTVGLMLLTAIALAVGRPVLAALLAGCLVGLGIAALVRGGMLLAEERRRGVALLADMRTRQLYQHPL